MIKWAPAAVLLACSIMLATSCDSEREGPGRPILLHAIDIAQSAFSQRSLRQKPARNGSGYVDDTFSMPSGAAVRTLTDDHGWKPFYVKDAKQAPLVLKLHKARFNLNNSRNNDPTPALSCRKGPLTTNPLPIAVYMSPQVTLMGGLIVGRVPQQSDWNATYCDSAAVYFKNSPDAVADGMRISRAWDGVRIGVNSDRFLIKNSWLTDIRDDAIENDPLLAGRIEDTLIDGAYMGLSHRLTGSFVEPATQNTVEISGSLIRVKEYPFEGRQRAGALIKADERSARVRMVNSIVAIEAQSGLPVGSSWERSWEKMSGASNNLILWLADGEIPRKFRLEGRPGFRLVQGRQARAIWSRAVTNWINCHPAVGRLAQDPTSDFSRCVAGTWGGYSS